MWWNNQKPSQENGGGGADNNNKDDDKIVKTAGIVVLSSIAFSILKAINPYNNNKNNTNEPIESPQLTESTQSPQPLPNFQTLPLPFSPPPQEPIIKKPSCMEKSVVVESSSSNPAPRKVEIVKGDTLWGLSRKYGVSIDEIKEANGLKGDTIYAGKKLIIP